MLFVLLIRHFLSVHSINVIRKCHFLIFEPNQGNLELKLFTMDAKFNLKGFERKKVEKNHKDDQRDLESILDRMDNFLTSDTLENLS